MSVSHQLLGWGLDSTNLFRGAILESGSSFTSSFAAPETLQPRFDEVAQNAGCGDAADVLKCLRGVSLDTFNSSAAAFSWSPVVDGGIIPAFPSDVVKNGSFVKVPLLIGGASRSCTTLLGESAPLTRRPPRRPPRPLLLLPSSLPPHSQHGRGHRLWLARHQYDRAARRRPRDAVLVDAELEHRQGA